MIILLRSGDPALLDRLRAVREAGDVPLVGDDRWPAAQWAAARAAAATAALPAGTAWATLTSGSSGAPRIVLRSGASWTESFATVADCLGVGAGDAVALPAPASSSLTLFSLAHALADGLRPVFGGRDSAPALHATPEGLRSALDAGTSAGHGERDRQPATAPAPLGRDGTGATAVSAGGRARTTGGSHRAGDSHTPGSFQTPETSHTAGTPHQGHQGHQGTMQHSATTARPLHPDTPPAPDTPHPLPAEHSTRPAPTPTPPSPQAPAPPAQPLPRTAPASPLRTALIGGSHLDPALRARAAAAGVRVTSYYGAAELSFVALDTGDGLRAFPGVELAVRGGILWVRSPFIASGYAGAPGPLRREGGWATVGDRAELVDGRLRLLGRSDDAILSASATIVPEEVEAVLRSVPGVHDAVVFGVPRAPVGALVAALVEPEPDAGPLTVEALRSAAAVALAPAHRPRRWFAGELPRTASGKPARAEAARRAREGEAVRLG